MNISIIIINYNTSELTLNCVESIYKTTCNSIGYEIIIVDNASIKNELKKLDDNLPKKDNLKLIKSRKNTGFALGNFLGVQEALGKYYLFLNNDTILTENSIELTYNYMQQNTDIAVCGIKPVGENGEFQYGFNYHHTFRREFLGKRFYEKTSGCLKRNKDYSTPIEVDSIVGSFMFFRANDFNAIGGFDTNLFLYNEEADICYRIKKKLNKKVVFNPNYSYTHLHGGSSKNMKEDLKKELTISTLYVLKKNHPYLRYLLVKLAMIFKYSYKSLVKPKTFKLLKILLSTGPILSYSLKHKQKIK